jgi:MoaA/NifB/PqqE/SkfB family radical SAM enzyme
MLNGPTPPPVRLSWPFRLRYSPFLASLVIIRRCNLACAYCNEFDATSDPVPIEVLEHRLERLRALGTLGIGITGGEPTLHPALPHLVRRCRELGFLRTGMITNGLLLTPRLIAALNVAGLQELQISIDGVQANATTQKVLANLHTRLTWLRDGARFRVTVSAVIGACPPEEAQAVVAHARGLGFTPRVLLVHDGDGRLRATPHELIHYRRLVTALPRTWMDFSGYRTRLARDGRAPYRCRAGSRYLYVDEDGVVTWCSQTRDAWSKPLDQYEAADLRAQFHAHKPCQDTCTLGCVRSASQIDGWRPQDAPG